MCAEPFPLLLLSRDRASEQWSERLPKSSAYNNITPRKCCQGNEGDGGSENILLLRLNAQLVLHVIGHTVGGDSSSTVVQVVKRSGPPSQKSLG